MRRLVPDVVDLPLDALYEELVLRDGVGHGDARRAWVALGSVASLDGSASVGGTSGRLGGEADRVAFRRLRAACDAVLVGAGTARVEGYRPLVGTEARRADRVRRGLADVPVLVVVSASLRMSPDQRIFADADHRPVIVTHGAAPQRDVDALNEVAEVVRIGGGDQVDLAAMLRWLAARGLGRVLCEGGPGLAGSLLAQDLIDEAFLTVAPMLVGGCGPRVVHHDLEVERGMQIVSVHEHDGELLLRYGRPGDRGGPHDQPPSGR